MRVNPYLTFAGFCEEAFGFYEKCFNGKIDFMMRYGESPMATQTPPGWHTKIMHATLSMGDCVLQGVDVMPDRYQKPQGFSVNLDLDDPAEADRIFAILSENGAVQMPIAETFWAKRFGMLVDRFDIPWMINCGNAS